MQNEKKYYMQNWKKTCALLILQGTVILPSFSENL